LPPAAAAEECGAPISWKAKSGDDFEHFMMKDLGGLGR
jgi:hypothetical protein